MAQVLAQSLTSEQDEEVQKEFEGLEQQLLQKEADQLPAAPTVCTFCGFPAVHAALRHCNACWRRHTAWPGSGKAQMRSVSAHALLNMSCCTEGQASYQYPLWHAQINSWEEQSVFPAWLVGTEYLVLQCMTFCVAPEHAAFLPAVVCAVDCLLLVLSLDWPLFNSFLPSARA